MYSIIRSKALVAFCGFVLLATSLVACKDNDDAYNIPSLQFSELIEGNKLMADAKGFSRQITFTSSRPWSVTFPEWIDVSPSKGTSGTHTITIAALENTGVERTGNIVFNYGISNHTLTLTQASGQHGGGSTTQPSLQGMPLAELIAKYNREGQSTTINDEVEFQAVVISDKSKGNTQPKNLHLQAEDAGIIVRFKKNHNFVLGSLVTVKVQGSKIQRFRGSLQIELADDTQAKTTGETREVEPVKATLQDIYAGKYENMLVVLDDVQFVKPGGDYLSDKKTFFHTITDCVTKPSEPKMTELSVAISSYAKEFKGHKVNDKRGRIVGIIGHGANEDGTKIFRNLVPRSLADIQLTNERCQGGKDTPPSNGGNDTPNPPAGGGDDTPTPPSNGGNQPTPPNNGVDNPQVSDHPIITAYVEGKGNDKFIQIYNPTDKAINLEGYNLRMENYSGSDSKGKNAGEKRFELKGRTLAPKEVLVIKHKSANGFNAPEGFKHLIDDTKDVCNFNGNDNVALFFNETMIDVIGNWGNLWLNGTKGAGIDITLKRKGNIKVGNTTFNIEEWVQVPVKTGDSFSFLSVRP